MIGTVAKVIARRIDGAKIQFIVAGSRIESRNLHEDITAPGGLPHDVRGARTGVVIVLNQPTDGELSRRERRSVQRAGRALRSLLEI